MLKRDCAVLKLL